MQASAEAEADLLDPAEEAFSCVAFNGNVLAAGAAPAHALTHWVLLMP